MDPEDQAPTLDEIRDQERRLVLASFDENDGIDIGLSLLKLATERDLPVTIEVRKGDRVVFRAARNGTNATNDQYVGGKARLVERFGHSSLLERVRYEAEGTTFEAATGLTFPEYAPHGGGFPLVVEGAGLAGVAIVSGLPQLQDDALIVECLTAFVASRTR